MVVTEPVSLFFVGPLKTTAMLPSPELVVTPALAPLIETSPLEVIALIEPAKSGGMRMSTIAESDELNVPVRLTLMAALEPPVAVSTRLLFIWSMAFCLFSSVSLLNGVNVTWMVLAAAFGLMVIDVDALPTRTLPPSTLMARGTLALSIWIVCVFGVPVYCVVVCVTQLVPLSPSLQTVLQAAVETSPRVTAVIKALRRIRVMLSSSLVLRRVAPHLPPRSCPASAARDRETLARHLPPSHTRERGGPSRKIAAAGWTDGGPG